tara:strand:+ start:1276 stop:1548 length:273 start_codon:yes stop_codon:yes gene_type:complete
MIKSFGCLKNSCTFASGLTIKTITMNVPQRKSLKHLEDQFGDCELYYSDEGIILARHDEAIESIGVRGGITTHLIILNNRFHPNGCWAKR